MAEIRSVGKTFIRKNWKPDTSNTDEAERITFTSEIDLRVTVFVNDKGVDLVQDGVLGRAFV
jgi:hypothetical protein